MRSILIAALMLVLAPSALPQNSDSDTASKLLALERIGKMQASELKDVKMLNEVLHRNFVAVDQDGRLLNKAQFMDVVQSATSMRYVIGEMSIRMHGGTAVITGSYQLHWRSPGKTAIRQARFIDTWILDNGRWVAIASVSTPTP